MALLGRPTPLVLDEPINGLDANRMRIMREVLVDITKDGQDRPGGILYRPDE